MPNKNRETWTITHVAVPGRVRVESNALGRAPPVRIGLGMPRARAGAAIAWLDAANAISRVDIHPTLDVAITYAEQAFGVAPGAWERVHWQAVARKSRS